MNKTLELSSPCLSEGLFASVTAYTDEALFQKTGVRIAFTERSGGVSTGAYESLNLGSRVGDKPESVQKNREILCCETFGVEVVSYLVPKQVHGNKVLLLPLDAKDHLESYQELADQGADGLVVEAPNLAALLCFADCVPLIIVSPSGTFAVVHVGWRGVENEIAKKVLSLMIESDKKAGFSLDSSYYNAYIGPHIRACCFETGEDVHRRFVEKFGPDCAADSKHIDLSFALRLSLVRLGLQAARIADGGLCTACENNRFFSYRAQKGVCGRQGAFALRIRGNQ